MKYLLLLTIIASLLSSCGDSRTEGCTDLYAINYNSFVDYDNGSCIYQVDVVFALDGNASAYLNADIYATEIAYYIDNDIIPIGFDYWNSISGFPFAIQTINPPLCYQFGYTSFSYEWIGSTTSSFYYEAIPNGGIFEWADEVFINRADQCIYIPLTLAKKSHKVQSSIIDRKEKKKEKIEKTK